MLHERVHALERELRRQRALVLVLLVSLGGFGLVAAQGSPAQDPSPGAEVTPVLRVRRLLVMDANDRPVLVASADDAGHGRLELGDAEGRVTQWLGVDESGRVLFEIRDCDERPLLTLGEAAGGGPEIVAPLEEGAGFRLGIDAHEQGALELFNDQGRRVVFGGSTPEGDGTLRVDNRDQERAFYVGDDARGNGILPEAAKPGARLTR